MPKQIGLLTIHGIGRTEPNYADKLQRAVQDKLDVQLWDQVAMASIFYQNLLQGNQERYWAAVEDAIGPLDFKIVRRFLLFALADAGSLEHKAYLPGSTYEQTQRVILEALDAIYEALGHEQKPLIVVAHSLGGHLISNYLWDAQQFDPSYGVWRYPPADRTPTDPAQEEFRRLKTMRYLYTMGCNIPLLVAGHRQIEAVKKEEAGYSFDWYNYYDTDDPLGWPLKPLSPSYHRTVNADIQINAGGFFESMTPLSHTSYWTDDDFIEPLVEAIASLIA